MKQSALRVQPLSAGYGGVGPATPAPHPDTWVVLFLDVESDGGLSRVAVEAVELLASDGKVVARAVPPWSLRRDQGSVGDEARKRGDFSEQDTVPFDGNTTRGSKLRLRVHAPLDTRSDSLTPQPARFRARLVAAGDPGVWVEGPLLGPWPTG